MQTLSAGCSWNFRNRVLKDDEQLHELGDALHNVSSILSTHGAWIKDEDYRRLYLRPYDERWRGHGLMLESFLQERIEFHCKKETNQPSEPTSGLAPGRGAS